MNRLIKGNTEVYFCELCSHLQTIELIDLLNYYDQVYEINTHKEEADQLYKIINGKLIYRAEHQANVLMGKIEFKKNSKVLDYGCANAPTMQKILKIRPDIQPFLFDVTDRYIPTWKLFTEKNNFSTHTPNPLWNKSMDVILSFYALEHVGKLTEALQNIKNLLKVGGVLYFIVPNVYQNVSDFIVADHINHFSSGSLLRMLELNGFDNIEIDDEVHEGAFVVKAKLVSEHRNNQITDIKNTNETRINAKEISNYWDQISQRILKFEIINKKNDVAIYGAGFFGNYIATTLKNPNKIICFVDQNKHLQGMKLNGISILTPNEMPQSITHIYVGLNPKNGQEIINNITEWKGRNINYFFM